MLARLLVQSRSTAFAGPTRLAFHDARQGRPGNHPVATKLLGADQASGFDERLNTANGNTERLRRLRRRDKVRFFPHHKTIRHNVSQVKLRLLFADYSTR